MADKYGKEPESSGYSNSFKRKEGNIALRIMEAEGERIAIEHWQRYRGDTYNATGWKRRGWGGKVCPGPKEWENKGGG